jgi:hypothetical protein
MVKKTCYTTLSRSIMKEDGGCKKATVDALWEE